MAKRILSEVEVDYTTALRECLPHSAPIRLPRDHLHHCSSVESLLGDGGSREQGSKNKLKVRTERGIFRPSRQSAKLFPVPLLDGVCIFHVCGVSFGLWQPPDNHKQHGTGCSQRKLKCHVKCFHLHKLMCIIKFCHSPVGNRIFPASEIIVKPPIRISSSNWFHLIHGSYKKLCSRRPYNLLLTVKMKFLPTAVVVLLVAVVVAGAQEPPPKDLPEPGAGNAKNKNTNQNVISIG